MVNASHALKSKSGFLTENFFVLRTYIYFALWGIWALAIYSGARQGEHFRQRGDDPPGLSASPRHGAAA